MLNNKKIPAYFSLILLLVFLCNACGGIRSGASKKISSSNPTYLNIDYENTSAYVDWQTDFQRKNIFLGREQEMELDKHIPLYVKTKSARSMRVNDSKKSFPLFLLDTINRNLNGYYPYVENPAYLEKLEPVRVHYHRTKEDHVLGKYKEELLNTGFSYRDIAFILIQFGVIDTYDHLFSEMVIMKEMDTADIYEVHYNCVYHICTSKCFDPEYKFFIRFDKKTRMMTIGKA